MPHSNIIKVLQSCRVAGARGPPKATNTTRALYGVSFAGAAVEEPTNGLPKSSTIANLQRDYVIPPSCHKVEVPLVFSSMLLIRRASMPLAPPSIPFPHSPDPPKKES